VAGGGRCGCNESEFAGHAQVDDHDGAVLHSEKQVFCPSVNGGDNVAENILAEQFSGHRQTKPFIAGRYFCYAAAGKRHQQPQPGNFYFGQFRHGRTAREYRPGRSLQASERLLPPAVQDRRESEAAE
jgi:hypothetical protein